MVDGSSYSDGSGDPTEGPVASFFICLMGLTILALYFFGDRLDPIVEGIALIVSFYCMVSACDNDSYEKEKKSNQSNRETSKSENE